MTESEQKMVQVRGFVPEPVRNSFKAVCAEEGKTMSEIISQFVESYVAERRKNKTPAKTK